MSRPRTILAVLLAAALITSLASRLAAGQQVADPPSMPDLSGLAWVGGDRFLAVHDAKNPDELERPRVSLLTIPTSIDGVPWMPVPLDWPTEQGPSSDLESAAAVPGSSSVLLVESGDRESAEPFRRIFHVRVEGSGLELVEVGQWPLPVSNVEGTAVASVKGSLFFLYAERAEGRPSTLIRWAPFRLQPITFGRFRQVRYRSLSPRGPDARPVSALDVRRGRLYTAGAFDPGDDNGPFRSVVWQIGRIAHAGLGQPQLRLFQPPRRIGRLDGLKVESIATRPTSGRGIQVYAGTDDENYGGALRLLRRR